MARDGDVQRIEKDRKVRNIILVEGLANVAVLIVKVWIGLATNSIAILSEAAHSLTDLLNNGVSLLVLSVAREPPDANHPYGHRKFETLAVFGLAALLAVVAFEVGQSAITAPDGPVSTSPIYLALMLGVMAVNLSVSLWQRWWAKKLKSDLLYADAAHTLSDAAVTGVTVAGWQIAAYGLPWVDRVAAGLIAVFVLYLAYRLFRRCLPVLLDELACDPKKIAALLQADSQIVGVRAIRSRSLGDYPQIDLTIIVDPALTVAQGHAIATRAEKALAKQFDNARATIHVEPLVSDQDEPRHTQFR